MIEIDLRGKSLEEVLALVRKYGLGPGTSSDITRLRKLTDDKYKKRVVCVWLDDKVSKNKDKGREIPAKATFILWDGRQREPVHDQDLHGFVLSDGTIEWGIGRTLDLMR